MIFAPNNVFEDDYDDFGWSFFTVASKEGKQQYLAATLRENLTHDFPDAIVDLILKGLDLPNSKTTYWGDTLTVDHQSRYNIPLEFGTKTVSIDFYKEFQDYVLRDGIVILGGNDNTDETHSLAGAGKPVSFGDWEPEMGQFICRKDGDWWTLFSPRSGNRIVLSFNDAAAPYEPNTPMLMDIKITDFCTHGCAYCYQGSTPNGLHMNQSNLWTYASMVAEAKVFEVAIGGGEPTQYPKFAEYVQHLHDMGVSVNFTTKSIDWLEDERRAEKIIPNIGAFAYSAVGIAELERILNIFKYREYDIKKFTVQIVPATLTKYTLESILEWCGKNKIRATLLGYKETGRGAKFKEIGIAKRWDTFDEGAWLDVITKLNREKKLGMLSIDTTMAAKYEQDLKATGIPEWMYHIEEGKYSMYMDLVSMQYGPSSYHLDKLQPFELYADVQDMFSKIESV